MKVESLRAGSREKLPIARINEQKCSLVTLGALAYSARVFARFSETPPRLDASQSLSKCEGTDIAMQSSGVAAIGIYPVTGRSSGTEMSFGVEEGFKKSLLLPTKHLRGNRGANDKNYCQRRYVAGVRRPRVAVPDSLEQRHSVA